LVLDDNVFDASENVLDGDWFDGASEFPSGDGRAGGAFSFGINVLPGDVDGDNVVGDGDYSALVGQFGLRQGALTIDLNRDGRVDLTDFATLRDNFGDTLPTAPAATGELELDVLSEPTEAAAAALMDPATATSDDDALVVSSAPAVDLLMPSLLALSGSKGSAGGDISEPRARSTATPQLAATGEYDLRPLSDDPASDGEGDLLVDVLAESALAVRL
jgi:hypothetical protein